MNILVLGIGTMGKGITQLLLQNNHTVYLYNSNIDHLERAYLSIHKNFEKLVEKGKISEETFLTSMKKLHKISQLFKIEDLDFVIEAVTEDMMVKKAIMTELNEIAGENTIVSSNTSSLSITEISMCYKNPNNVIGIHFFNPAPIMELVEITKGIATSDSTYSKTLDFVKELNKQAVDVKEAPGFIVNRILIPMINEAVFILSEGIASAEDIDKAMKLGANHPIGPLALADLIGLDICLNIMDTLYKEFNDSKYRACVLLRNMVRGNKLGRKTKVGFYSY